MDTATKDSMSATSTSDTEVNVNAKLNAAPPMPMLCKRQCYDFMGKMIQWKIDGELDHIPKMLGLIDGGSISFADRDWARGLESYSNKYDSNSNSHILYASVPRVGVTSEKHLVSNPFGKRRESDSLHVIIYFSSSI